MNLIKSKIWLVLSFVKWRVLLIRYLMRTINNGVRVSLWGREYEPSTLVCSKIKAIGAVEMPPLAKEASLIKSFVQDRLPSGPVTTHGHPFINLLNAEDIHPDNPILQLAFSRLIFDAAIDYFGGELSLAGIQVLYSKADHKAELRESQLWHKDYSDSKSLHAIIYLNDVLDEDSGPFVFIDKETSKKIKKSPIVRRINDNDFFQELKSDEVTFFYGKAGSFVLVDPAACYHHGSRGRKPRLALFVTFNTSTPYVKAQDFIIKNKESIIDCCLKLRPDLSKEFVGKVVG